MAAYSFAGLRNPFSIPTKQQLLQYLPNLLELQCGSQKVSSIPHVLPIGIDKNLRSYCTESYFTAVKFKKVKVLLCNCCNSVFKKIFVSGQDTVPTLLKKFDYYFPYNNFF